MPYLDIEPEELRRKAEQHARVAANIRKWGEIPHDWLATFADAYGTIADPVRAALVDYYNRRHERAERRAAKHDRAREELLAGAIALEQADQSSGRRVDRAGAGIEAPPVHAAPNTPVVPVPPLGAGPVAAPAHTTTTGSPSTAARHSPGPPGGVEHGPGPIGPRPQQPVAGVPGDFAPPPRVAVPFVADAPRDAGPFTASEQLSAATAPGAPRVVYASEAGPVEAAGAGNAVGAVPVQSALAPLPEVVAGSGADSSSTMPQPLATGPLAAAVHPESARKALPSLVVGERDDEDLELARTLLAATLAAVADTTHGLDWAVAVLRTPGGPVILLTSNEGRGWLPPGLFLPSEVALPWRWAPAFGRLARRATAGMEGTADPARMLAEFGRFVSRPGAIRISALASSGELADDLRADLVREGAEMADLVSAAESAVDLTSPGDGLVDRLALAGSDESQRLAAAVPAAHMRAKCLELARAAENRLRAVVPGGHGETATSRVRRQRILDELHAGRPVPVEWWDRLRVENSTMAVAAAARRVDVSHIPVGGVPQDLPGAAAVRSSALERRANELLLLLVRGEPDRQMLRDVIYTYDQIVEHPLSQEPRVAVPEVFGAVPAVVDAGSTRGFGAAAGDTGLSVPHESLSSRVEPGSGAPVPYSPAEQRRSR
ncbi:type VII secretion target [Nocardia grenadensis]|uniref:type VII secretion target n=1 Tax=Nocardia grenadensis TaxID=931537 RepID=UPI003D8D8EE6